MKSLIIYAHPNTGGHCKFILEELTSDFEIQGIDYELLDLYKMKYDPVLHEDEHYTAGKRSVSKQNRTIQMQIKNADLLIFIYPLWWGSMPAILKGFIDKVFVSGYAFEYINGRPVGLLKGKTAFVFMTSGGPAWYYKLTGNVPARMIKSFALEFCGIKTKVWHIDRCLSFNDEKKKEIVNLINKVIEKIK